ncbi:MAG: dTMP kinase [Opitutales bacterium]|nr:dTMP kinase [Opitutales bacterium]
MKDNDDTRGYLISFEGSEGSGKTTQISQMASHFESAGYDVVVTREPGGTPIGEEIRRILMHATESVNMFPETELLLFAASRAQLVREVIQPALDEGKIVLCDRFMDSTTVYQGVARKIQSGPVHLINTFAVGEVVPDVTVVIDIPAEVGFERIRHRVNDLPDRMEAENIEFYQKVRNGYLMLAKAMPERFVVVDGELSEKEVTSQIWKELRKRVV